MDCTLPKSGTAPSPSPAFAGPHFDAQHQFGRLVDDDV